MAHWHVNVGAFFVFVPTIEIFDWTTDGVPGLITLTGLAFLESVAKLVSDDGSGG